MFLITLVFCALTLTVQDIRGLLKEKQWTLVLLHGGFVITGLGLSLLIQMNVELPSVAGAIITLIEKIFPFIPAFYED